MTTDGRSDNICEKGQFKAVGTSLSRQLHVVFGLSAAGLLRRALFASGRKETVISPGDDFSFGPLAPADPVVRARWVEEILGDSDWMDLARGALTIVSTTVASERAPIVWVAPDNASSVAGFLWWLSQIGHLPVRQNSVPRLGLFGPEILQGWLDQHVPLTALERGRALKSWQTLVSENAPLRVLSDNGLVSAPIEYFDELLLSHLDGHWRKFAHVVGMSLSSFYDEGRFQTGHLVLASRLRTLARSGTIEWRGDLHQMRYCELRRTDT